MCTEIPVCLRVWQHYNVFIKIIVVVVTLFVIVAEMKEKKSTQIELNVRQNVIGFPYSGQILFLNLIILIKQGKTHLVFRISYAVHQLRHIR